jgi:membrane protein implicated in regulation of membrane protease activity
MALAAAIVLALVVLDGDAAWAAVAAGGAIELGEAWFWWRWSHRRRPAVGVETLVGAVGVLTEDGWVHVNGERWRARGDARPGERVRVVAVAGLELVVEPANAAS